MELSYGFFPEVVTGRSAITFSEYVMMPSDPATWFTPDYWASIYEQYARYDARYAWHDPTIVTLSRLEILMGPSCFVLVWLVLEQHAWRHPVQLVLCSIQCFGTLVYFFEPVVAGTWSEVFTSDPLELWTFVLFLNGLWIGVPIVMIYQSFRAVVPAMAARKEKT
jgi:hypothetical protein